MDLQKMAAEFADAVMRVIQEATLDDLMAKPAPHLWTVRGIKQDITIGTNLKKAPKKKPAKAPPVNAARGSALVARALAKASKNVSGKVSESRPTPVMRMLTKLAAKRDKASDKALSLKALKPLKTRAKKKPAAKKPSKKSKKAGRR